MSQTPFPVTGIWVRKADGKVEVLAEDPHRGWVLLHQESISAYTDGEVSHIIEPAGMLHAPVDKL